MSHDFRTRLVTALVLILVFGAGVAVGLVLDEPFGQATATEVAASDEEESESEPRSSGGATIHRVGLTPEQRMQADSLLELYRAEVAQFQEEYRPRYWAIVDAARDSLMTILDEEQAALYDSLLVERDRVRGRPAPRP